MLQESAESPDVTVLVPAAGEGRRMGGATKQFRDLGDAPLLVQTIRAFERHSAVSRVVVVTLPGEVDSTSRILAEHGIVASVVPGGATRQESVRLGLASIPTESDLVLIHDAVRPFVTKREISDVVEATRVHGAAAVAIPVVDTIRRATDRIFGATVSRDDLYRMQTPQGFFRALIVEVYEAAHRSGASATDDVEVAQMAGYDVYRVDGSSNNFKITTVDDWRRAEQMWPSWSAENRP